MRDVEPTPELGNFTSALLGNFQSALTAGRAAPRAGRRGLRPDALDETHRFVARDPGGARRSVAMTTAEVTTPVQHMRIIDTAGGPVGYMFTVEAAERRLVDAFAELLDAGVGDLVVDLRYNGGGFGAIANILSYMAAGENAEGRNFPSNSSTTGTRRSTP